MKLNNLDKIINLLIRTKFLQCDSNPKNKWYHWYLHKIKFSELYKDYENNKLDKSFNKYRFDMVNIIKFNKTTTMIKYLNQMIIKGLVYEKI